MIPSGYDKTRFVTERLWATALMGAGHGGKSGRYHSIFENAEQISFVLSHLNVKG